MRFFDCNVYYGLPANRPVAPVASVADLLADMQYNGVERALTWHAMQILAPQTGNEVLAQEIAPHANLSGCWAIQPNQTHEFPHPVEFLRRMKEARVAAVRIFPGLQKFLLNAVSMGDWLEVFSDRQVPVLLSMRYGVEWRDLYDLLRDFPELVCVICDHGCWGEDRLFRPLIEKYPNVYIDTAQYLLDGGIEAFVQDYGPGRMLFGSGYPDAYFGGMMLAIKHAEIDEDAKEAIACGNLERILEEVQL
jgi:uncharacterized protein